MSTDTDSSVEERPAVCQDCGKARTDEPDYTPVAVIFGGPLGWYSSESDGELCPECLGAIMNRTNRRG